MINICIFNFLYIFTPIEKLNIFINIQLETIMSIVSFFIKPECLSDCICKDEALTKFGFPIHVNRSIPLRKDTDLCSIFKGWSTEKIESVNKSNPGLRGITNMSTVDCRPKQHWIVGVILSDSDNEIEIIRCTDPQTQMLIILRDIYKNWDKYIGSDDLEFLSQINTV